MRNSRHGWENDPLDPDFREFETECALMEVETSTTPDLEPIAVLDPQILRALAAGGLADTPILSDRPFDAESLSALFLATPNKGRLH